jgi:arginyl-tRNA synthetase
MSFEERLAGAVREAARRAYGIELDGVPRRAAQRPEPRGLRDQRRPGERQGISPQPREVAEALVGALEAPFVREAEIAGPGSSTSGSPRRRSGARLGFLLDEGDGYGRREASGKPILLEFVSVNPTGPMTVAHGRHAAYGDSLARVLKPLGKIVSREYYFNDGGKPSPASRRVRTPGSATPSSTERSGTSRTPNGLYRGEYVWEIARDLAEEARRPLP